jgi:hypothetical protein
MRRSLAQLQRSPVLFLLSLVLAQGFLFGVACTLSLRSS